MQRTSIVVGALAALSFPIFASAQGQADAAAAAQRAKLVTSVQAQLGVSPVDGQMGPRTHEAIEAFQRAKGLEPSGQLDKPTVTALGLGGAQPSAAAGASSHMQGQPSTPIGPAQSSSERSAEPLIKPATPTGETK
jgi:peptidoglycan hydrolase-like protein with peptidoglycan-binding domain